MYNKGIEGALSDNIVDGVKRDTNYKPLSKKLERFYMKKLKLSYYNEVSDDLKQLYLDYYMEVTPEFALKYRNLDEALIEEELQKAIDKALKYRDFFVKNNQRLVFSIARKYKTGIGTEDLYQQGEIGLLQAVEKFDIEQNVKFSTFATVLIKHSIELYLDNMESIVRIPYYLKQKKREYYLFKEVLLQKLKREPSRQELMELMDINEKQLDTLLNVEKFNVLSLNTPITSDGVDELGDFIANDEIAFTEKYEQQLLNQEFRNLIEDSKLFIYQKRVLYSLYGFNNGGIKSYDAAALEFGVDIDRIKKVERESIEILRQDCDLIEFYNRLNCFQANDKAEEKVKKL